MRTLRFCSRACALRASCALPLVTPPCRRPRATRTFVLPVAPVALPALRTLACAGAPLEHLFSPSPFLRFARSLVPSRHSNTCSPRRPSCASRARLCRRDSNIRFPYRPRLSFSRFARTWLACPRRARPPADHRRARHPPAEHCLGLGLRKGGYVSGLLVAKNEGGGFLLQRKSVV